MHNKRAPEARRLKLLSTVKEGLTGAYGLARALPAFFRERITVEQAETEIKKALETREERFLELVRTRIYEHSTSPYLKLLKIAGCELADLQAQVRRDGLEATLEKLAGEGVYLTSDEFKGKKEVVRGGESFRISPAAFERPDPSPGFVTQSSGTRNLPVRSLVSLEWLRPRAVTTCLFFAAHDLFSYSHAMYDAILPGEGGINNLLIYSKLGVRTERWFGRKVPIDSRLEATYHSLTTHMVVLMAQWFGPGCPRPEFLDIQQLHRIVRWAEEERRAGHRSCIKTTASNAARIARIAQQMGITLEGTKFSVTGEPLTESKNEVIERAGARTTSRYGSSMGVNLGYGCPERVYVDEMHVDQHTFAIIQHPTPLAQEDPPIRPLLLTTLYPSAPRLHLNVANGDYAQVRSRACGCALEKVGLTLHLHHIRSYEKFTSEGMNYFYGDLYEFVEKTLPSEFGGGPGDYQLVEEEDENGQTRLSLVVHPELGAVDETKILLRLQQRLAESSSANLFQAKIWQNAGTLRVRRQAPHASARGKILPLHIPHHSEKTMDR